MIIVAFAGKMGSGKSTMAGEVFGHPDLNEYHRYRTSFAASLKDMIYVMFPEFATNNALFRKACQEIGMAARKVDQDVWAKKLKQIIDNVNADIIVIDDVRFKSELDFLYNNFKTVLAYKMDIPLEERMMRLIKVSPDMRIGSLFHDSEMDVENIQLEVNTSIEQVISDVKYHLSHDQMEKTRERSSQASRY